jgi:hypothetical protein
VPATTTTRNVAPVASAAKAPAGAQDDEDDILSHANDPNYKFDLEAFERKNKAYEDELIAKGIKRFWI